MAVRTTVFGTRTAFGSTSNLTSLANNAAKPLAAVDNTGSGQRTDRWDVELTVTLAGSGVSATGSVEWFLIQAIQNTGAADWTDGLDPAGTADIAASLKNARLVRVSTANANSQVVAERFTVPTRLMGFWSLVALNKSGAALAASGHGAYYQQVRDDVS